MAGQHEGGRGRRNGPAANHPPNYLSKIRGWGGGGWREKRNLETWKLWETFGTFLETFGNFLETFGNVLGNLPKPAHGPVLPRAYLGAGQVSLNTVVSAPPGTTIFQNPGPQSNGSGARIYPRVTGIWSWPQLSQCTALPCCTAAHTRPVPNVALRSPHAVSTECFLGCVGQLIPLKPRGAGVGVGGGGGGSHTRTRPGCPSIGTGLSHTTRTWNRPRPIVPKWRKQHVLLS